jgi:hypothetical protein
MFNRFFTASFCFALFTGLAALISPAQALAQAKYDDLLGPLADGVSQQLLKGWQAGVQDGWFVLKNATDEAEQSLTVKAGPPPEDGRLTSVNISLSAKDDTASIGLLVRNGDDQCILDVIATATAHLFCVTNGKADEIATVPNAAKLDGNDVITMVDIPGAARLYVNGNQIGDLDGVPALGSEIGIMAYDKGTFGLADFSIAALNDTGGKTGSGLPPRGGGKTTDDGNAGDDNQTGGGAAADAEDVDSPLPMFGGDSNRIVSVYLGLINSIFMHEFGHALIGELQLPSTGPEEDAVDIFSALKVVEPTMYPSGDPDTDQIGVGVAKYAALQWYYSGKLGEQQGASTPWQDEHTADLKRFRNIFCVMYGANPSIFQDIVSEIGFDDQTLGRCEEEFNKQNRAWRTILAPHTRVGTWNPEGLLPADAPGSSIKVSFEPSKSRVGKFVATTLAGPLQGFVDELAKSYAFPRPLSVVYRDCDELNAWYSQEDASITMCYNLIENLAVMISNVETDTGGSDASAAKQSNSAAGADIPANAAFDAMDELKDAGVPPTSLLFPAPYRGPTPNSHTRATIVTTATVVGALKDEPKLVLIDTSGQNQSLPGAMAVTDAGRDGSITDSFQSAVSQFLKDKTQGDTSVPIIFFGAGPEDRSSYNAALRAGTLGYKVFWYRGGIEAWTANDLPLKPVADDAEPQSDAAADTPSDSAPRFAIYEGVDFYGSDVGKSRVADVTDCLKACLEDKQCQAFTMNVNPAVKKGPNCFLKDSTGRGEVYEQAISGAFLAAGDDGSLKVGDQIVKPTDVLTPGK